MGRALSIATRGWLGKASSVATFGFFGVTAPSTVGRYILLAAVAIRLTARDDVALRLTAQDSTAVRLIARAEVEL